MSTPGFHLFFEWSAELDLDYGPIDQQHKRLVNLIAELVAAMTEGKGQSALEGILAQLIDYTMVHFEAEERLMKRAGYLELPGHRQEHDLFGRKALQLQTAYHDGTMGMSMDVMEFLRDWLKTHILGSDKAFWGFVASNPAASQMKQSGDLYR